MCWKVWIFVTILVLSATLVFELPSVFAKGGNYIGVYPSHITNVKSQDTITVRINISTTVPFAGYQFYLYWNRTYINATSFTDTPPAAWDPFYAGKGLWWDYNSTHGRAERAALDTHSPLIAVTGNFTVATINFTALMDVPPETTIPLELDCRDTFLANADAEVIEPYHVYDKDVHLLDKVTNHDTQTANVTPNTSSIPLYSDEISIRDLTDFSCDSPTYIETQNIPIHVILGGPFIWSAYAHTYDPLTGSTHIWIALFATISVIVVAVTISISSAYIYSMRKQKKKMAKF